MFEGAPGDIDGDGDVDWNDFLARADCLGGPQNTNPGCDSGDFDKSDMDSDGDVDLDDLAGFQVAFTTYH